VARPEALVHLSMTVTLITSSPLMGEDRGEGEQSLQRPLTLTRDGRGDLLDTNNRVFCRIRANRPDTAMQFLIRCSPSLDTLRIVASQGRWFIVSPRGSLELN
jgi:hypothetical protein